MQFLPYGHQSIDEDDVQRVVEVLRSDWLTQGPVVDAFEHALASKCGAEHAVVFNSGTAALHAACAAGGVGDGDEVLTSALSFAASANCARYVGAVPMFGDIEPTTLVTPAENFVAARTSRTRAVIPVHFAGRPIDLTPLQSLREDGILVIEDAAHALGAVGSSGTIGNCAMSDMACFSFHPVKSITTGEGGAVTTNDATLATRLRTFRTHGIVRTKPEDDPTAGDWYYEQIELGMNYRITDVQCALGLSQLEKLDRFVARRNELAAAYRELFAGTVIELTPPCPAPSDVHAYHLLVALLPEGVDRRAVFDGMRDAGIGVQVHYIPIYWHPYYRALGFERGLCPETERAYHRMLSLPIYPELDDADVQRVADQLLAEVERVGVAA